MLRTGQTVRVMALLIVLLFSILTVSCCGLNSAHNRLETQPNAGKPRVAVSIVPQAGFVKAVAGDLVDVLTMIPPGANPEDYAPSPQTMENLSLAQLYFAIGVPAEINGILPRLQQINTQMRVIDLPEEVDRVYPALEISPGEKDPHRGLSPTRVSVMVKSIAQELAQIDPQNAAIYKGNAQAYQSELLALHEEIELALTGLKHRSFIVYHPALGYFAEDYGLKMIALEAEGKTATAKTIQEVIDQAKREHIKVIFYQAEVDSRQAEVIAHELGGEAALIAPLAADYIDNLRKIADLFAFMLEQQ